MSALSEVDLRDFARIDVDLLQKGLENTEAYYSVFDFDIYEYCNTIRRIQKKLIAQTPALFKP